ncbi:MAG: GNAT family N-acetyltransferase [Bacteroidia bacterium]|nr:GNAT family N-acetyltransferase [Bacteroidia bacterium]
MKPVMEPVPTAVLQSELNAKTFVRKTNNGSNEVYIIREETAPNTLREIGRLREVTFRNAGGGTGLECDLDEYDTGPGAYSQLLVWNSADLEIVGGYRFIHGKDVIIRPDGTPRLATAHLLDYSPKFMKEFLPKMIELGRSFVQPHYQPSSQNRKGLFSLDNLWDGLGALVIDHPDIDYFFGKVTMYPDFNPVARDMIIYFMNFYFPDPDHLVSARNPQHYKTDISVFRDLFRKEMPYKEAHAVLNQQVRSRGENIPPLINSYMNLSPTMRTFGTAINDAFGDVEETGIMVKIADIYESKMERHVKSYQPTAR